MLVPCATRGLGAVARGVRERRTLCLTYRVVTLVSRPSSIREDTLAAPTVSGSFNNGNGGETDFEDAIKIKPIVISHGLRGKEILNDSILNKGTAFTYRERSNLGLAGLLPPRKFTIHEQMERAYKGYKAEFAADRVMGLSEERVNILKHMQLVNLFDRNETLFYRLLLEHIEELAPIIYTPTVGLACQQASQLYRKPRGVYFSYDDRGNMHQIINNWPRDEVDVVVVTDGSRILGLGDLGTNGMAIPIGKLSLYTAVGGIDPARCLPVQIDVGTNNETLLDDPHYLGRRHRRVKGDEYTKTMDEFMIAVRQRYPTAVIQFEDFSTENAHRLLDRYRDTFCTFNDDMQGTGSVALAGVMSALRKVGPAEKLQNQRIICVGAGSAGVGVCSALLEGMVHQGMNASDCTTQFWLIDDRGLMSTGRPPEEVSSSQRRFLREEAHLEGTRLTELIAEVKPTLLIGLSGVGEIFKEADIREMSKHVEKPLIFALSNPTSRSECTAEQAYTWSDGRCIYASGSPFDPVALHGKIYEPSQLNNMYIFPAVGLGAKVCGAKTIKQQMFYELADELSHMVEADDTNLFPRIKDIRKVTQQLAVRFCKVAERLGVASKTPEDTGWDALVSSKMYEPSYRPVVYAGGRMPQ